MAAIYMMRSAERQKLQRKSRIGAKRISSSSRKSTYARGWKSRRQRQKRQESGRRIMHGIRRATAGEECELWGLLDICELMRLSAKSKTSVGQCQGLKYTTDCIGQQSYELQRQRNA